MKKLIEYAIYVLAFGFLGFVVVYKLHSCNHNKITLKEVHENVNKPDSAWHEKDKQGIDHVVNNDVHLNQDAANILYHSKIEEKAKRSGIKSKQVTTITESTISLTGDVTGHISVPWCDSVKSGTTIQFSSDTDNHLILPRLQIFNYDDSFILIKEVIENKNVHLHYEVKNIPLNYTGYWKRKWFLARKHYFINAYSDSPNVHINKLTEITISKK